MGKLELTRNSILYQQLSNKSLDMDKATKKLTSGIKKAITDPIKLINFLKKCSANVYKSTISDYLKDSKNEAYFPSCALYRKYSILTTSHCLIIAKQLKSTLDKLGFVGDYYLTSEMLPQESDVLNFIICPQFFEKIPPNYVVVQLEQATSHWFDERYWQILKRANAILEFSEKNLSFLKENGIPLNKIFYFPITPNFSQPFIEPDTPATFDLGFVGAINERRRKMLGILQGHYSVNIINEKFGADLEDELKKCKILLNVHYYEHDSLETTRLTDFSRYPLPILSEDSYTPEKRFFQHVIFFEENNPEDMLRQVEVMLNEPSKEKNQHGEFNYFDFYLLRFLLAKDLINFSEFFNAIGKSYPLHSSFLCLTLTETIERKNRFLNKNTFENVQVMEGLRHDIGWIGCGMSYKFLASLAILKGSTPLTICEDDMEEKPDSRSRYKEVLNFLEQNKDWNLFSGLMADADDSYEVLDVSKRGKENYIKTNKTVSTVFNIYNMQCLMLIASWSPYDRRKENTIDRYLEASELSGFYTTLPFLCKQSLEVDSSIWTGINNVNRLYEVMIERSEANLFFKLLIKNKGKI